jgi:hypothetical protein
MLGMGSDRRLFDLKCERATFALLASHASVRSLEALELREDSSYRNALAQVSEAKAQIERIDRQLGQ